MERLSKICGRCKIHYLVAAFYKNKARYDGLNPRCKPCVDEIQISEVKELRIQCLTKLGGQCVKCGYKDNVIALAIDHINGGGNEEARLINNPKKYYLNILNDVTGLYQVLCANCNTIKRTENRESYHRECLKQYIIEESNPSRSSCPP